jgi:hypothetical protein
MPIANPYIDVSDDTNYEPEVLGEGTNGKKKALPIIDVTLDPAYEPSEGGGSATKEDVEKVESEITDYKETIKQGTGFLNREQCRLIFDTEPAKLTIQAKDPEKGVEVSFHGKKYVKYEDSITISWTGNRYIIYDDEAQGLVSVAQPDSLDHIIVAYVYFNPDSAEKYIIAADERHQSSRNPDAHRLHHLEFGATHLSGGEIVYHAQGENDPNIALSNIFITDEGLDFHIIHADNPYTGGEVAEDILEQSLNPLKAPVLYLQQTDLWACDNFSPSTPIKVSDNNIPTFNDRTNAAGGYQSELESGQFVTYFIATTNSKFAPVKMVQGSLAHTSADDCFADEFKALGLPMPEIVALWQVAYEYNTAYISESNPYGIRIAQVRKPERKGGTQQSFGGQTSHALLSERNEPNQHQTGAIYDEVRAKALNEVLNDIDEELGDISEETNKAINKITLDGTELTKVNKTVGIALASAATHGAMPKESFQALSDHAQRLEALESGVIPIRISFTTVFATANPTTAQITTYLSTLSPIPAANLVRITDTDTRSVWVLNTQTSQFVNVGVDTITNFGEGTLGGIVGASDTEDGKIFAENNGKGSVIGWNTVVRDDDIPTIKNETIEQIKPDDVDTASFKGVVAKTTSYASPLSVTLDNITLTMSGGGTSSAGKLTYTNNTNGWILVSQTHLYNETGDGSHQYLITSGKNQGDASDMGYTRGIIAKIHIGTESAKIYEGYVFSGNGTSTSGITACVMTLRRVV